MVNNATYINKTNNHISPQTIEHQNKNTQTTTRVIENKRQRKPKGQSRMDNPDITGNIVHTLHRTKTNPDPGINPQRIDNCISIKQSLIKTYLDQGEITQSIIYRNFLTIILILASAFRAIR